MIRMINYKRIIILSMLIMMIACVSAVSATDIDGTNDVSDDIVIDEVTDIVEDGEIDDVDEDIVEENSEESGQQYVIYVGQNENEGNGSKENPFATFDLACDNIKERNNVTINVLEGTYELGSVLNFDCVNLHVNGTEGEVIIKNKYNEAYVTKTKTPGSQQAFGLTSSNGTFKMSNIICDASSWTQTNTITATASFAFRTQYFLMFLSDETQKNIVMFNNCSFINYYKMLTGNDDYFFYNCKFSLGPKFNVANCWILTNYNNATFQYCLFNLDFAKTQSFGSASSKMIMNDCWFGQNSLPHYFYSQSGSNMGDYVGISMNRFAVFSISEEKIDDNTYDIIGKLMWNDSTTDGIENLAPMTVTLTSATGEIPATTTLENGTFKVRYTTQSKEHNITAKLDSQELNLAFNYNVDMNAEAKPIYYGEDQNITINLPYNATGIIKLVFEDETSEELEITDVSSFNYTIKKTLKAGVNQINISLIDDNTHSYGSTILNYEVLKLQTTVNETTFVDETPASSDKPTFTINLPEDATGNFTVTINGKNYTKELVNGSATIVIEDLSKGEYNATLTYSGDDKYDSIIKNTTASVKEVIKQTSSSNKDSKTPSNKVVKKTTKITAKKKTFKAKKKIKKYAITLKSGKKPVKKVKVTLKIKGKTYKATTNAKGKATFKIKNLKKKGKYTAVIKFKGNKNYKATSKKVKITIKK